jgi:hypothetical protein
MPRQASAIQVAGHIRWCDAALVRRAILYLALGSGGQLDARGSRAFVTCESRLDPLGRTRGSPRRASRDAWRRPRHGQGNARAPGGDRCGFDGTAKTPPRGMSGYTLETGTLIALVAVMSRSTGAPCESLRRLPGPSGDHRVLDALLLQQLGYVEEILVRRRTRSPVFLFPMTRMLLPVMLPSSATSSHWTRTSSRLDVSSSFARDKDAPGRDRRSLRRAVRSAAARVLPAEEKRRRRPQNATVTSPRKQRCRRCVGRKPSLFRPLSEPVVSCAAPE